MAWGWSGGAGFDSAPLCRGLGFYVCCVLCCNKSYDLLFIAATQFADTDPVGAGPFRQIWVWIKRDRSGFELLLTYLNDNFDIFVQKHHSSCDR